MLSRLVISNNEWQVNKEYFILCYLLLIKIKLILFGERITKGLHTRKLFHIAYRRSFTDAFLAELKGVKEHISSYLDKYCSRQRTQQV